MSNETELAKLRMENERLYESRDAYKHDYAEMVISANKWRLRAFVAESIARYLNSIARWWYPKDLKKEIKINSDVLFAKWSRRELSHEDMRGCMEAEEDYV